MGKSTLQGMNLDQIMPMLKGECSWGGRNRQQWGRLVLFYTLYFISIFGLFFLIVFLFHESTTAGSDGKRPLLHGRGIQSPGINYQPRLANADSDHKAHIDDYHRDIDSNTAFVYKSNSDQRNIYVKQMKSFLKEILRDDCNTESEQPFHDCFKDVHDWGDCTDEGGKQFGFEVDKPCLFFRVNKVIDWNSLGFFKEDIDAAFTPDESNILSSEGYCSEDRFQNFCNSNNGKEQIEELKKSIFSEGTAAYDAPFVKCLGYSGAEDVKI